MSSGSEIAVLSYHGWEIATERLVDDVRHLREAGWRDVSLDEVEQLLSSRARKSGRFFHVTSDDGSEADHEFVAALRYLSCPATLFVCLGRMSDAARAAYRSLLTSPDFKVEDHSLWHNRAFHYRRVIGFHSDLQPLLSSPERLDLELGSPVCMYGSELALPRFLPADSAVEACHRTAHSLLLPVGTAAWTSAMARELVASGLGYYRIGKLCIRGQYESQTAFEERVRNILAEGRRVLTEFMGRTPAAFAYPWWQPGAAAERRLRQLGYRMTFSGIGLCRQSSPFGIPRIYINNDSPRPLRLDVATLPAGTRQLRDRVYALGRRMLFS